MPKFRMLVTAALLAGVAAFATACGGEEEGPAEEMGEALDEAMEEAEEALEEAEDAVEEATE